MAATGWINRTRQMRLIVRRAVASLHAGSFRSIFKGSGLAFEEVRPYQPGDEVRAIDWNVTARMGQPYVKRFVEERELRIYFLLDVSGSLQIGSGLHHKRDIAAELMALLAIAGLRWGDSLGLITFSNQLESYAPPRRGMRHALKLIYQALYHQGEKQGTNLAAAFDFTAKMARCRSVVVVLSDFLDDQWRSALDRLLPRHDVYLLQVHDPLDLSLPGKGLIRVTDAETECTRVVDGAVQPARQGQVPTSRSLQEHWIPITTAGNHVEQLLQALARLRQRRRAK